jgi:hypothetical protein
MEESEVRIWPHSAILESAIIEILCDAQLSSARDPVSLAWPLETGARILTQMVQSDLTEVIRRLPAPLLS